MSSSPECSPVQAADYAVKANIAMALGEAAAFALTGNVGFIVEAGHNAGDGASFLGKKKAMEAPGSKSLRLRKTAGLILGIASIAGLGGAAYHAATGKNEDASEAAIAVALAAAAANTRVAFRAHSAEEDHSNHIVHGAHADSKLHAFTDAGTGWLYATGLVVERHVPGTANYVVLVNSLISGGAATTIIRRAARG